jgi:hypothetical protein
MSKKNSTKVSEKQVRKIVEIREADLKLVAGGAKTEAKPE